jgi:hypothetical protein
MFWLGGQSENILVVVKLQSSLSIFLNASSRPLLVLETKSTIWLSVSLLYIRSILLWPSIRPVPSSQPMASEASSQKSLMPFFIVSRLTQYVEELSSQSKYSDGAEDGAVVSVGVPDGVSESLALPDTAPELSEATLHVGVVLSSPVEGKIVTVDSIVEEAPVDGPVIPLLSLTVIEDKFIVDAIVGESPVVGPVIPLLSPTVLEEELIVDAVVGEAPVVGPTMPLLSLTDIEEKLTVSDPKISGRVGTVFEARLRVPYTGNKRCRPRLSNTCSS